MRKVAFFTLGCRVNQYETEAMSEAFLKKGYTIVDFDDFADIYIINTCTVTNVGDKKSRQMIRKSKKINPDAVVAVAGCYAQVAPDEVASIEGVDVVVGTSDKGKIVDLVEKFLAEKKQIKHVENIMTIREFEDLEIDEYQDKTRAFLKIQDGCDRFCSYCLIPYARGPVRSKRPEKIVREVQKLVENGFKEIILSGIHVASYGRDLGNINLVDIIEKLDKFENLKRIRIGSVDPTFFTDEVIERLSKIEKLCHHFHLSLQSGCNNTLKRMNRHYTTEEYEIIVNKLRETFSDVSITTDIIVGFPGETEEEFNETFEFLKRLKLAKMHIFKYSPRKGTKAATFNEQVAPEIKDKRSKLLIELDEKNEKEFTNKFLNKRMDVLFEETKNGYSKGYTKNYIKVQVQSAKDLSGEIIDDILLSKIDNDGTVIGKIGL
ncbi:30S ribosomal protein S12 methylthiotransferase [Fervidicella metallireducens AeB]|uniref:Threonylcarbamoyladenosine tRNA methylthiotransferase MtaB n=1 Tax=Fervidicella metallireducens AeB TaxID=1403537 RepID=A0A017RU56_9CLOT|nr:tRNA (N(6)-L-threonylcarbamoyladenosine(37)-C(2))-methylthiotransferase MtaB [Fervidicella metallireducens]EYE88116.1 30S ribosomal protein S12 methylthiotransferase [Fervidicella metallireducens AeB]